MPNSTKLAIATLAALTLSAPAFAGGVSMPFSMMTPSLSYPAEAEGKTRARRADSPTCSQLELSAQIPVESCGLHDRAAVAKLKTASDN